MNKDKENKFEQESKPNTGKGKPCKGKGKGRPYKDTPKRNDWKFYAANDTIAQQAASIPFNYIGGTSLELGGKCVAHTTGTISTIDPNKGYPVPSVLSVIYVPSIGVADNPSDAINMAAVQLYSKIRSANSGAKNYEAPDVMMYLLAMKDIYNEYFELRKILGLTNMFTQWNHNAPDLLIRAADINPVDLRANQADYHFQINTLAEKINSFAVPKYFKMFDRAAYINAYVFTDSSSIRGQFYSFKKAGYFKWSGTASQTGTSLVYTQHNFLGSVGAVSDSNRNTFAQRLSILNDMLDALFFDSDALTMSGDILKAFGDGELFKVTSIPIGNVTPTIYDEDILSQIHNSNGVYPVGANNLSDLSITYQLDVTQANQVIQWKPHFEISRSDSNMPTISYLNNRCFNSHKDTPQYTDVLEWTRLMHTADVDLNRLVDYTVTSCGLELVLYYQIHSYGLQVTDPSGSPTALMTYVWNLSNTYENVNLEWNGCKKVHIFDWYPILYSLEDTTISISGANLGSVHFIPVGDLKVCTIVSDTVLKRINECAVYGATYGSQLYSTSKK